MLNFEPIRDIICLLVACKDKEEPIKNEGARVVTTLFINFSDTQGQLTPNSTADDWPKVLSLRTLLVRSVQHLVTYTKMFVCMSSFRIRLMTSSLMSTNRVTALEPYIPIITDY